MQALLLTIYAAIGGYGFYNIIKSFKKKSEHPLEERILGIFCISLAGILLIISAMFFQ